jgi:hypothetical protein
MLLWTGAVAPTLMITAAPSVGVAQDDAPKAAPAAPDIDVKIDGGGERHVVWFTNPMVLAAAGIGLIVVIAIIAMASRGGGTTIIREK